ncbi:hypothetical protein CERSUDRAFT_115436 [Gelatoporia subvermispora B]|uniref:DRBM domain-containing protein n=1 Tax=Ceriporiopsis subvermispora (strain B) TaxID=914234 RepID=M2QHD8_CERS8|nr:hypothetical protein CERSUDRAFT_115436 [Gelatoporia subvermispora B]
MCEVFIRTTEAVLQLYLDSTYDSTRIHLRRTVEREKMTHWRMQLNNILHRVHFGTSVVNWQDQSSGPQYQPVWTSMVLINGLQYGIGTGRSKDASREAAAYQAYQALTAQYGVH